MAGVDVEKNSGDTMETWLYKATNPLNTAEDWESIVGFCDQVNKELEGPQTAVRLLVHKIQSPNEKESLLALTTLEACVKNCGRRFQQEIGKFRFINEMIKVVSPKYLGNHTTEKVKKKCIELLYNWSQVLSHEPKIAEAYQMLRRQGIIKQDPIVPEQPPAPPSPPPRPNNSIFEDEEKSKMLSRLLKSRNPDDLQAANRLIKNMVKQDAERQEKVSKRVQQLETVNNNVKLLSEMLHNHEPGGATESDKEIMKELYNNLESQRPNLFRLASDTDERDGDGISDILQANDEVIKVMSLYDQIINKADVSGILHLGDGDEGAGAAGSNSNVEVLKCLQESPMRSSVVSSTSLLDDQLLSLGLGGSSITVNGTTNGGSSGNQVDDLSDLFGNVSTNNKSQPQQSIFGPAMGSVPPTGIIGTFPPVNNTLSAPLYRPQVAAAAAGLQAATAVQQTSTAASGLLMPAPITASQQSASSAAGSSQHQQQTADSSAVNWFSNNSTTSTTSSSSSSGMMGGGKAPGSVALLGLESIDEMSKSLLQQQNKSSNVEWKQFKHAEPAPKLSLNQMSKAAAATAVAAGTTTASASSTTAAGSSTAADDLLLGPSLLPLSSSSSSLSSSHDNTLQPLDDISVPLESIRPGTVSPQTVYDKNDIKIVLHFGKDRPRPDVQVIAVSVTSTASSPIKNFLFQASVPKVLKVKLQPASGSDLPAYNPILPPSAITQVMLIAHSPLEPVRLKFKISYTKDVNDVTDIGELPSLVIQ